MDLLRTLEDGHAKRVAHGSMQLLKTGKCARERDEDKVDVTVTETVEKPPPQLLVFPVYPVRYASADVCASVRTGISFVSFCTPYSSHVAYSSSGLKEEGMMGGGQ